jgi:acetyl-CoA acetyltransferase
MVSQMEDFTSSRAFRVAGPKAFAEAGITHNDADHLMIYDAFAHLPIYGLEDLGFVPRGEAGGFIAERNTAPRRQAAPHQWRRRCANGEPRYSGTVASPCSEVRDSVSALA